jgi:hypothetical protein
MDGGRETIYISKNIVLAMLFLFYYFIGVKNA